MRITLANCHFMMWHPVTTNRTLTSEWGTWNIAQAWSKDVSRIQL